MNVRQVLISAGSGLFCGGTQRTALLIRQSTSVSHHRAGLRRSRGESQFEQRSV
jgi:hypothetical protein